ncbi:hypothetical protein Ppa06_56160 [Planomonospora parontospora subsp. parontospora]|uniref:Uncharacterized protein n=2 Tax=Planomonospora parontospora TaxID=58119 RepID=A0AA37F636_9ACTN|nr:hypothetical protein GCM10010126_45380 [Planomonospora parontospora]GII11818.1 hypothetical protein Ppa06_56160 [Planomonospora parontospora subsp. parontospora]
MAASWLRQVQWSAVGMSQYPVTAYGARIAVSNVPHGSVKGVEVGVGDGEEEGGAAADDVAEAACDRSAAGPPGSPERRTITTAATAARIATPRRAVSQRTFRTLPFS